MSPSLNSVRLGRKDKLWVPTLEYPLSSYTYLGRPWGWETGNLVNYNKIQGFTFEVLKKNFEENTSLDASSIARMHVFFV